MIRDKIIIIFCNGDSSRDRERKKFNANVCACVCVCMSVCMRERDHLEFNNLIRATPVLPMFCHVSYRQRTFDP